MVEGIQLPSSTIQSELLEKMGSDFLKDTMAEGQKVMITSCNKGNCVGM